MGPTNLTSDGEYSRKIMRNEPKRPEDCFHPGAAFSLPALVAVALLLLGCEIPESDSTGRISVTSTPSGARIFLNHSDTGRVTPYVIPDLAVGSYSIHLTLAEHSDWGPQNIPVSAGQITTVNATMEPIDSNGPDAPSERGLGLRRLDVQAYQSANIIRADPVSLPSSADLSVDVPIPGNQGGQGSCVGWAVAYAVKTYHERIERGWPLTDNRHVMSPAYVYNQIKVPGGGAYFVDAFTLLVDQGVSSWAQMPYDPLDDRTQPSNRARAEAANYKIADWGTVLRNTHAVFVQEIKRHLVAGNPVLIGIPVYPDFDNLSESNPVYDEDGGTSRGAHAVVIVGYDDRRQAFKIANSWGTDWGIGGYGWIDYDASESLIWMAYVTRDVVAAPDDERPGRASDPSPGNAATGVAVDTVLRWTRNARTTSFDVYLGVDPHLSAVDFQGTVAPAEFTSHLAPGSVYYWRVDARGTRGITRGSVWTFTTAGVLERPGKAVNRSPSDGATGVVRNPELRWDSGGHTTSYDVYFGTDPVLDASDLQRTQATRTYYPTGLRAGTRYYWRIDAKNGQETTRGDVWTFTTATARTPTFGSATIRDSSVTVNQALHATLPAATGGDGTLTYSLSPALPTGLSFNRSSRVLSGTPTGPQGRTRYTYTVTDADGDTDTLSFTIAVVAPEPEPLPQDFRVLLSIKDALIGDGDASTLNWSASTPPASWTGVSVGDGRVVALDLSASPDGTDRRPNRDLSGSIPAALGNLSQLQYLVLSANTLSGTIPAELGSLSRLEGLWLSGNDLSGRIPTALGNLSQLRYLYLNHNDLSGTIPGELGSLSRLERLEMYGNDLSGEIPAALGSLSQLRTLDLGGNDLSETIPAGLSSLSRLEWLDLSNNDLSGTIPGELGNLSQLQTLHLYGNRLSGCIPANLSRFQGGSGSGINSQQGGRNLPLCEQDTSPVLPSISDKTYRSGDYVSERLPTATGGNGSLTYSLTPTIPALTFDAGTRTLSGTPPQAGTYHMRYRVQDEDGDTDSESFTITVVAQDTSPVLPPIGDKIYTQGVPILPWKLPAAMDGDGVLHYELYNIPLGLSMLVDGQQLQLKSRWHIPGDSPDSFRLSGTPLEAGTYNLPYNVRDEDGDTDSNSFTITVRYSAQPRPVSTGKVYWTSRDRQGEGRIMSSNMDGTEVKTVYYRPRVQAPYGRPGDGPGGSYAWSPKGIAISDGKLYWVDGSSLGIRRSNLNGTGVERLVFGGNNPYGIAVLRGKMYWTDGGNVQRANLDGTGVENVWWSSTRVAGIAVSRDRMYWTASTGGVAIRRANLDGTSVETLVDGVAYGIAISNDKMYWTSGAGSIQRANLDGTSIETLVSGLRDPRSIVLHGGRMYWIERHGAIKSADLNGTAVSTVVESEEWSVPGRGIAVH